MDKNDKLKYEAKAKIFKALAHPTRLWIVEQLSNGEQCVCELVNPLNVDFSTVSRHLTILKQAEIVEDDKRGKKIFYRLKIPCVMNFMTCVEEVMKFSAEAQRCLVE